MVLHKPILYETEYIGSKKKGRRRQKASLRGHYDWLSSEPKHNERHESWLGRALSSMACPLNASAYRCFKKDGSFARLTPDDDDDYRCR
jgi:hypothetical protein